MRKMQQITIEYLSKRSGRYNSTGDEFTYFYWFIFLNHFKFIHVTDIEMGDPYGKANMIGLESVLRFLKKRNAENLLGYFKDIAENKPSLMLAVDHFQDFIRSGCKRFIPSNNLIDAMRSLEPNIGYDHLTVGDRVYFEMPKGVDYWDEPLKCIYISIPEMIDNVKIISISGIFDSLASFHIRVPVTPGDSIEDSYKKICDKSRLPSNLNNGIKTFLNLLIYAKGDNEEMISCLNNFPKNSNDSQKLRLEYTEKPFFKLGMNAELLNLNLVHEFGVRGHFRWQPHGEKMSKVKLIFIQPHKRSRNSKSLYDDEQL